MIKLFIKKMFLLLPIPIIIVVVNYFADPAQLFKSGRYEKNIAKLLHQGNNVANVSNLNERLLQKYFIEGLKERREIVVFGSSRSMQIGYEIYNNESFFNNCLTGASLEDYMALYNIYRRKGLIPLKVIIGVDPWIFNINNGQKRWKFLITEYKSIFKIMNSSKDSKVTSNIGTLINKYYQIISPSYFQQSVKKIILSFNKSERNMDQIYITQEEFPDETMIRRDGLRRYSKAMRTITIEEIDNLARKFNTSNNKYSIEDYKVLDPKLKLHFEQFITLLLNDGVEISVFLPSYYPMTYEYLVSSRNYRIIDDVENYIRKIADTYNIKVYGSYNPKRINFTEEDFYDEMHPKTEAVSRLFQSSIQYNISK
ncbi:hypothetical protein ACFL40_04350 [candidate division KSB1 bacterium]